MKRSLKILVCLSLLAMLGGCGNDNKSGKKNNAWDWAASGISPYTGLNTPSFGAQSVSTVIAQNPCVGGFGQRIQLQIPLTNFPTVIPVNDVYVGVTSYGDVAALVGTGGAPTFIAYVCPRSMASGQGQLFGVSLGSYSQCGFKPIAAATMKFPDGTEARFRMLDYRNSLGQPFSMCRQ